MGNGALAAPSSRDFHLNLTEFNSITQIKLKMAKASRFTRLPPRPLLLLLPPPGFHELLVPLPLPLQPRLPSGVLLPLPQLEVGVGPGGQRSLGGDAGACDSQALERELECMEAGPFLKTSNL